MTSSSYLQRIVARMGTPSAGVGTLFTPPDAPAPTIFDPFAEAEPLEPEIAPPAPRAVAPPQPQPSPTIVERGELLPPGEVVDRVIHEAPAMAPIAPIAPLEAQPPTVELSPPAPAPLLEPEGIAPPPIETTAWETLTQIVQQFMAPPADEAPPVVEPSIEPAPQAVLEPEIEERIRYEFVEPPSLAAPISTVEPPLEAEASAAAPIFESPAPQITIGDIVVEIVTRPEPSGRAHTPPPRAAPPVDPPAPIRAGVRSKRGYGIGQM